MYKHRLDRVFLGYPWCVVAQGQGVIIDKPATCAV